MMPAQSRSDRRPDQNGPRERDGSAARPHPVIPRVLVACVYLWEEPGFAKMRAVASRLFRQRNDEWKVLTDGGNIQFLNIQEGE